MGKSYTGNFVPTRDFFSRICDSGGFSSTFQRGFWTAQSGPGFPESSTGWAPHQRAPLEYLVQYHLILIPRKLPRVALLETQSSDYLILRPSFGFSGGEW